MGLQAGSLIPRKNTVVGRGDKRKYPLPPVSFDWKSFKGEGRRIWTGKERPRVDEAEVSKLFRDWQSTVSTLISRSNRGRQVDTKQNWVRFPSTWASEAGRKLWSCVDKNQPH